MKIDSFKDLIVWKKGMDLVKEDYLITSKLPKEEQYGLSSQIRRSALSIPLNIAEGSKRGTKKDYIQFLRVANGSVAELETQILILEDLYKSVDCSSVKDMVIEIQKMLSIMIKKLT